tara:strand:- start:69 stop:362 length:294 start_codon:yes stop_codon:yes gene_type:complete
MAQQMTAQNGQNDSAYELKEGQINVFKNTRKEEGSKQPDYWGKVMVGGVEKRVSLWLNQSQNGNTYMGGQISDYEPQDESAPVQTAIETDVTNGAPF